MTRDETVALLMECEAKRAEVRKSALAHGTAERDANEAAHAAAKEHWNAWALDMLERRQPLDKAGKWKIMLNWRGEPIPENEPSAKWLSAAKVNFSNVTFSAEPKLKENSSDNTKSKYEKSYVLYTTMSQPVLFDDFIFPGYTQFDGAKFEKVTLFRESQFMLSARFDGAQFKGTVWFQGARFLSYVRFFGTHFSGAARFDKAEFDWYAGFPQAIFSGYTNFDEARFEGTSDFCAIRVERLFSLARARFEGVPDFIQAHFEEAPRLDNVVIKARVVPHSPGEKKK